MRKYLVTVINRIWADLKKFWVGIVIYIIYYILTISLFHSSCPMLLTTGLPCPGCGMLRALFSIITFRFSTAWYLNPVSFGWFIFIIVFIAERYLLGRKYSKFTNALLIIVCMLTIARYIYGMINYFPYRIPFVFRKNNLFTHFINL